MELADAEPGNDPFQLPIEPELDLHTFRPKDVKEVVSAYIDACMEKGIREVRIIHGKGIGDLRRTVHALLANDPRVESYAVATEAFGGLGATLVHLRSGDVGRVG